MTPFERAGNWCSSLARDRHGLPPCHGCAMHDACASDAGALTQESLDAWTERVGAEFVRIVEGAQ